MVVYTQLFRGTEYYHLILIIKQIELNQNLGKGLELDLYSKLLQKFITHQMAQVEIPISSMVMVEPVLVNIHTKSTFGIMIS